MAARQARKVDPIKYHDVTIALSKAKAAQSPQMLFIQFRKKQLISQSAQNAIRSQ